MKYIKRIRTCDNRDIHASNDITVWISRRLKRFFTLW